MTTEKTVDQQTAERRARMAVKAGRLLCNYHTEPDWPDFSKLEKPATYVMRSDGVYAVRDTDAGLFIAKVAGLLDKAQIPGFVEDGFGESFRLKFGKIPIQHFKQIMEFFQDICNANDHEVYAQIFWDPKEKRYWNHVPYQKVSKARVEYSRNEEIEKTNILVLEIHSHNSMSAYFSGTDNDDEKADRIFGVVGKLDKARPEVLLSYVCSGKRVIVKTEDVFEDHESAARFPDEWKSRVTFDHSYGVGWPRYGASWTPQTSQMGNNGGSSEHWAARTGQVVAQTSRPDPDESDEYWGEFGGRHGWVRSESRAAIAGDAAASTVSTASKTPEEIKAEVDAAGKEALKEVETVIRGRNFLQDNIDIEAINQEIKEGAAAAAEEPKNKEKKSIILLPASTEIKLTTTKLPESGPEVPGSKAFFPGNEQARTRTSSENVRIDDEMAIWQREQELVGSQVALSEAILTAKKKLDGQKYSEAWMNSEAKENMFQDLLAFCEEEDVKILIKVLLDSNHELEILRQLKPRLDELQKQAEDLETVAG